MSEPIKLIKKIISKENYWKIELLNNWQQLVLIQNQRVCIESIIDQTLVLGVCHPAIAQQLAMHQAQILQKLSVISPKHRITRLAFRTMENKNAAPPKKNDPSTQKRHQEMQLSLYNFSSYNLINPVLTQKELKSLDSVCSQSLKQLLQRFYAKCKQKEGLNAQAKSEKGFIPDAFTQPFFFKPIIVG